MYCSHCGKPIPNGATYCPNCGAPVTNNNYQGSANTGGMGPSGVSDIEKGLALGNITKKMQSSSKLWLIMGWIQIVLGAVMTVITFITMANDESFDVYILDYIIDTVTYIMATVTGIISLGVAKRNKGFVNSIQDAPVGIIDFFEHMNIVFPLIMNLIFGGLITIVAAFIDMNTKREALNPVNRRIFEAIEMDYKASVNPGDTY